MERLYSVLETEAMHCGFERKNRVLFQGTNWAFVHREVEQKGRYAYIS
jgi:hypothetical protein